MLILGSFEYSIELEQALAEVEQIGVPRKHLMVIPMDIHSDYSNEAYNRANDFYYKGIEVGIASATASSVVGVSIGFIIKWGPIIGGLSFALIGFLIGFVMYNILSKKTHRHLLKKLQEITVIVECMEDQAIQITNIFWKYRVLTIGRVPKPT